MLYLIVPPIIIIIAVAILIVFLTRILSSSGKSGSIKFSDNEKKASKTFEKSKAFIKNTSSKTSKQIKKSVETVKKAPKKYTQDKVMTQGIKTGDTVGDNVVSLRKKSMVSDKLDNGEVGDGEELKLMKEIEVDPKNSKKYEQLGDYYMEQERFEDARECYKYVLRLNPKHKRAQVAMRNLDRVL